MDIYLDNMEMRWESRKCDSWVDKHGVVFSFPKTSGIEMLIFACLMRLWIPKRDFSSLMDYPSVCCWTQPLMGCVKRFHRHLHVPELPSSPEVPRGISQGIPGSPGHTPSTPWPHKPGAFHHRWANLLPPRHLHQTPGLKPFLFYLPP